MLYLHTLGDALITVGEKQIRPTAPLVFAALLYLGMERGRRVPRAALQELLFPNVDERSGAHSLRQLLYKLRQLGAPIETDGTGVVVDEVSIDAIEWKPADVRIDSSLLKRVSLGLLPGYQPAISPGFERWLDDIRSETAAQIRSVLLGVLARSRRSGDQLAVQQIATALLRLDPLNEEATLSQAEALALSGQKHDAVRILEEYSAEVGDAVPELRMAPEVLRRRIVQRVSDGDSPVSPILGRQEDLAWLLAQFARVAAGHPTVTLLWGDAGIGKTRLVQEFSGHVRLTNARLMSAHCQAHDVDRPLGALLELVPMLLDARGALGIAPKSLQSLRRFVGQGPVRTSRARHVDPELAVARIQHAVSDLLHCVAAEGPVILLVEDAQWLDEPSFRLLMTTILAHTAPLHLLVTVRNRPRLPKGARMSEGVFLRQLAPLDDSDAARLLRHAVGHDFVLTDSVRDQCLAIGGGNPLFLCTVAEHLRLRGAAPSSDASIVDLLQQRIRILNPHSLLLLRCVAALGNHGTPARLAICSGLDDGAALLALQELADRALVVRRHGAIKCAHDLFAEAVLSDASPAIRVAVYERVATALEEDGIGDKQVNLLWSCAEVWRLAENNERATRMLLRCSEFALEIGQPTFACSALEKAQDLCEDSQRAQLIESTIRVAELAGDYESVLRNVQRHRAVLDRRGGGHLLQHHSDLAEVSARRLAGEPVWHFTDSLRRCARDSGASASHRHRAAWLFLGIAVQHLEKAKAVELYSQLEDLRSDTTNPLDASRLRMLFGVFFGDMHQASAEAEHLVSLLREREEGLRAAVFGDIGTALFYGGKTDMSIDVLLESAKLNHRRGALAAFGFDCCRLASFYECLGEWREAQSWMERVERLSRTGDLAAFHLSNRLGHALRAGDLQSARADLEMLGTHSAAKLPHAIRTVRGMEILLAAQEGTLRPDRFDLTELEDLDDRGRDACEHHVYALALFYVYMAAGRRDDAIRRMREYVCVRRRERYSLWPYFNSLNDPLIADALEEAIGKVTPANVGTAA